MKNQCALWLCSLRSSTELKDSPHWQSNFFSLLDAFCDDKILVYETNYLSIVELSKLKLKQSLHIV